MAYYRLTRNLKTHFGGNNNILCMHNTSDSYLFPNLTTDVNTVSCRKCIKILLTQNKDKCPFRKTASHEPDSCTITETPCDTFGNVGCITLEEELRIVASTDEMKDINNYRQNHPELIVRDLEQYVLPDIVRDVLKYRGVNKWLRVRRLLIQLKTRWRDDIKELEKEKDIAKMIGDIKRYHKLQGYIEGMISCRMQIKALTHSPRDIDFPTIARDFGVSCTLPIDFPARPHKRWFWKYDKVKVNRKERENESNSRQ